MNKIIRYTSIASFSLLAFACDKDDFTGDSTLSPTDPVVTFVLPEPANFVEKDSTFEFTISINTPQIVDISIPLSIVDGDATEGEDFSMDHVVTIPAHRTSTKASVKIVADDVPEETETFTVQIGGDRTGNAQSTPQTVTFTIMNVTEGDLPIHFAWDVDYFDASGAALDPDAVADLILFITDEDGDIIDAADGATFEDFVIPADWPDGDYLIKAGVYAAVNPGELGGPPVVDLSLEFSQVGEISSTEFVYPAALTVISCDWNVYTLASVTKVGTEYTVNRVGDFDFNLLDFTGAYKGNGEGYDEYEVDFYIDDCNTIINDNFLDVGLEVPYVFDLENGTVTIPFTVLDASSIGYPNLTVEGNGTFDPETLEMEVYYDLRLESDASLVEEGTHTFTK
ncbi:MAG TPA: Calx-beta domain-containing protein [Ohtaekwangia sp.]|nr:Calx-beta domain-containing protein [Ohtaekwangia sp.]